MNKTIQDMPKVILHLHLDGSLRPESVQRWLQKQGIEKSIEDVTKMLRVDKDCRDLNEYLQRFDLPAQVLQEADNIEEATYELFEDLSKQNVIYAEVRFAPTKHMEKGLSCSEVVEAAVRGMERAKARFGIDGSLILCCMRGEQFETNLQAVSSAKKFLNKGVSAIDLAGAEALFPTEDYRNIFEIASKEGIPFTIHAGETDGPESIKAALEFGAKRIGHGVRSIEDKTLMDILRIREIPLEVCPISNLQTQAVEGKHPLEELYRKGLFITISTDNNTVSNTSILDEYDWILRNTDLTYNDLIQMNRNAARFIFAPPIKKAEITAKIDGFKNREDKGLNK
jgi:adenosine deaminase